MVKEKIIENRMDQLLNQGTKYKEKISGNNQFIKLTLFRFEGTLKFKHLLSEKIEYKCLLNMEDNKEFEFD